MAFKGPFQLKRFYDFLKKGRQSFRYQAGWNNHNELESTEGNLREIR